MINRQGLALGLLFGMGAVACTNLGDRDGSFILPDPSLPYPDAIQHYPEPINLEEDGQPVPNVDNPEPYVLRHYQLGPPDYLNAGEGGLTVILEGTGEALCVVADPEGLADDQCRYDDGDVDLFVGKLDHYTAAGAYDTDIGEFQSTWVDPLGVEHTSDTDLCQLSSSPTQPEGRGTAETCAFDTEPGQQYVVVLRTFSVPVDDNVLNVALLIQPGHRGDPNCVFNAVNYLVTSAEELDESDAAYPDNEYAGNRNPCLCPSSPEEYQACGLEAPEPTEAPTAAE